MTPTVDGRGEVLPYFFERDEQISKRWPFIGIGFPTVGEQFGAEK